MRIGYLRVAPSLCFKPRLSAKPLIWKWFFYSHANKTHFHEKKKGLALSLVLKVRVFEQVNHGPYIGVTPHNSSGNTLEGFLTVHEIWNFKSCPSTPLWNLGAKCRGITILSRQRITIARGIHTALARACKRYFQVQEKPRKTKSKLPNENTKRNLRWCINSSYTYYWFKWCKILHEKREIQDVNNMRAQTPFETV